MCLHRASSSRSTQRSICRAAPRRRTCCNRWTSRARRGFRARLHCGSICCAFPPIIAASNQEWNTYTITHFTSERKLFELPFCCSIQDALLKGSNCSAFESKWWHISVFRTSVLVSRALFEKQLRYCRVCSFSAFALWWHELFWNRCELIGSQSLVDASDSSLLPDLKWYFMFIWDGFQNAVTNVHC